MENNWLRTSKNEREDIRTFRAACDEFFKRKAEFFKSIKESMAGNLEKKKALCEKAEALKESTDWKATADILKQITKGMENNRSCT